MAAEHSGEKECRASLRAARRIIIKLGTSTVTEPNGELCAKRVEPIAQGIAELMKEGRQAVLVTSGAVGLGRWVLGLHTARLKDMAVKQACAAAGQGLLMAAYKRMFEEHGIKVAQVLLTEEDFSNWRRYSNLRRTMEKLIGFGVLPIVNENDTVSTAELEEKGGGRRAAFSDNDRLAALAMSGLEADALVLMTNVPGLMRTKSGTEETLGYVERITPELRGVAAGPSLGGRGGMSTKLEAAEIAMNCGGIAAIAAGNEPGTLKRLFAEEKLGTVFAPGARMRGKRRWIAFAAGVSGRVVVDGGAHRAITARKASLLSSGVVRVEKQFGAMDVVSIVDTEGREFARGIANCASADAFAQNGTAKETTAQSKNLVVFTRNNIVLVEAGR
ncbi:MAG: glutamate 5-kinase [Acidobacteria bacterium]|nr:glutamate 5-kinase [Acidobacteriota bacterium]MBS1866003.1 glutamate 5-kinase [Acidobacteriota bacterium]